MDAIYLHLVEDHQGSERRGQDDGGAGQGLDG
jgi:hypothetical protein